jgi:hypothetical protein
VLLSLMVNRGRSAAVGLLYTAGASSFAYQQASQGGRWPSELHGPCFNQAKQCNTLWPSQA